MADKRKSVSKFLAVMLRHRPEEFGIELDDYGFTPLEPVYQAIKTKYGERYSHQDILAVVEGDQRGKKRYEIDKGRIRAMYGHSAPSVKYPPCEPPTLLYHGTNAHALEIIREEGLQAMNRQYVHLTTNLDNARVVAARRTRKPIILTVRAEEASAAGYVFHQAEAEHFLVKKVPPSFIDFPEA